MSCVFLEASSGLCFGIGQNIIPPIFCIVLYFILSVESPETAVLQPSMHFCRAGSCHDVAGHLIFITPVSLQQKLLTVAAGVQGLESPPC